MHEDLIRHHLADDERLVWSGRPAQGLVLRANDIAWIPISLFFTGFIVFWLSGVLGVDSPIVIPFAIVGFAFLLCALYMLVGRFIVDAWKRLHTVYALTDQRVLIFDLTGGAVKHIAARSLASLPEPTWTERPNGSGSIVLHKPDLPFRYQGLGMVDATQAYAGFHFPWLKRYEPLQFVRVRDVSTVYRQVLRAKHEARQREPQQPPPPRRRPVTTANANVVPLTSTTGWNLRPGEKLLWSGRPRRGLVLRKTDAYWIPVGLFGAAFSGLLFTIAVIIGDVGPPVNILATLYLLFGLHVCIGRFFADAWQRSRTVYALTDRRVIIARRRRDSLHLRELALTQIQLHDVSWRERKDGTGMIWFARNLPWAIGVAEGIPAPPTMRAPKFDLIDDVETVYRQFLEARDQVV